MFAFESKVTFTVTVFVAVLVTISKGTISFEIPELAVALDGKKADVEECSSNIPLVSPAIVIITREALRCVAYFDKVVILNGRFDLNGIREHRFD